MFRLWLRSTSVLVSKSIWWMTSSLMTVVMLLMTFVTLIVSSRCKLVTTFPRCLCLIFVIMIDRGGPDVFVTEFGDRSIATKKGPSWNNNGWIHKTSLKRQKRCLVQSTQIESKHPMLPNRKQSSGLELEPESPASDGGEECDDRGDKEEKAGPTNLPNRRVNPKTSPSVSQSAAKPPTWKSSRWTFSGWILCWARLARKFRYKGTHLVQPRCQTLFSSIVV